MNDHLGPGAIHRLSTRVSKASRLAGSPINYYHAHADIRETLSHLAVRPFDGFADGGTPYSDEECERYTIAALERFYSDIYGHGAWSKAAPSESITEVRA